MKRVRTRKEGVLTDGQKWLATAGNIGRNIPYLEYLMTEFEDDWNEDEDYNITPVRIKIRSGMRDWMNFTSEEEIIDTISYLDPAAIIHLRDAYATTISQFLRRSGRPIPD